MSSEKVYLLISAPKTREDTFNTLNKKTANDNDFSSNWKFAVPDLKVGTLDSLMHLSDELHKYDAYIENATRKIATQLFDVLDSGDKKERTDLPTNPYDNLTVNNNNIDTYLQYFRWDEAKYPTTHSLKALTEVIHVQVAKLEEELKAKGAEYQNVLHALAAEDRKGTGNLLTKDLSDIIKQEHVIDTEYLESLFVAVPKYSVKQWQQSYEKLTDFVLPRSSLVVTEDSEYALYRVVLFKRVVEDFKNIAREKKFFVREFKYDPNRSAKNDKKKLEADKDKIRKNLIRWCKTNFSEAFVGWIHLKAIRIFVESVLRYGLPTNFQAMLILPNKGKSKQLRKALQDLYGHLSSKNVFKDEEEDEAPGAEKFYPYVSLDINLDFRTNKT